MPTFTSRTTNMCQIFKTQFTECSHHEQQLKRCQDSFENARQKDERKRKKGWFKSLFSSFTSSKKDECGSATIWLLRNEACSACTAKVFQRTQGVRRFQRGDADQKSKKAYGKYMAEQSAKIEEHAKRSRFVCSICADEGRNTKSEERISAINGGLCCARGLDEYLENERREGRYGRPLVSRQRQSPVTDSQAVSRSAHATPWYDPATQMQVAAKHSNELPKGYKWDEDPHVSADTNTVLLKDYLSKPGSRLSAIHASGGLAYPPHTQPDIDWDRWAQAVQTHHGRYPPAGCPPRQPLPPLPIRRGERAQGETQADSSAENENPRGPRSSVP